MGDDFSARLERESAGWVAAGIISDAQRGAILARPAPGEPDRSPQNRLTGTIAAMGALLVGVGVILFFASNWQVLSPGAKMALLLGALGLCHGAAYRLDNAAQPYPRMARTFYFLACLLYGANIFLLAQAYNISAHWPTGVLWWGLGTLPLALLLSSRAMSALALGALTFWMGSEVALSLNGSSEGWGLAAALLAWGCAALSGGRLLERRGLERPGEVFQWFGLALAIAGFFPTTFYSGREEHRVLALVFTEFPAWHAFVLGASAAALAGSAVLLSAKDGRADRPLGAWTAAAAVWGLLTAYALPVGSAGTAVAANLVFLGGIIALLFIGYRHALAYPVNLGLVAFAMLVVARYFDFMWKYLDRAAGFILGGLLLLLLGFTLERGRRVLLRGPEAS